MTRTQARKWLDDHGHAAIPLPRKGQAILNNPPMYQINAGIDSAWTLTALGAGTFTLDPAGEPEPDPDALEAVRRLDDACHACGRLHDGDCSNDPYQGDL